MLRILLRSPELCVLCCVYWNEASMLISISWGYWCTFQRRVAPRKPSYNKVSPLPCVH